MTWCLILPLFHYITVTDESSVIQRLVQGSRGLGAVIAAIESEAEAIYEAFTHMRSLRSDHGRAGGQRSEPGPRGENSQGGSRPDGGGQEGSSEQQGKCICVITSSPRTRKVPRSILLKYTGTSTAGKKRRTDALFSESANRPHFT